MSTLPILPGLPRLTLRALGDAIHGAKPPCVTSPEVFFGPDSDDPEPDTDRAARVASARDICATCPVRLECLAYALRTRPEYGVWAGCDAEAGELTYLTAAAKNPANARSVAPQRRAADATGTGVRAGAA